MASAPTSASCLLSEDQFRCSICMDVFRNPVTTPCGHNFCKMCITRHWDINRPCRCPNCKEPLEKIPDLKINTLFSEITTHFMQAAQQEASRSQREGSNAGEASGPLRQQPVEPMENLDGRLCPKHDKLMEFFCETDQACVCMICTIMEHGTHDVVLLEEGYERKKDELRKKNAEMQKMIQSRRLKIEELKCSVAISRVHADRRITDGVEVLSRVVSVAMESAETQKVELVNLIREKQMEMEELAEDLIKELEREIYGLERRSSEVSQLSQCEDHLRLLQNFPSVSAAPATRNWTEVSVCPAPYEVAVAMAAKELVETLRERVMLLLELKEMRNHAVELTFDPNTVHPHLLLSEDRKVVRPIDVGKSLLERPWRFIIFPDVLAEQSFSSGRFYYEVQVGRKMEWIVGVAKESLDRNGPFALIPQKGYWAISLRKWSEYRALAVPPVLLSLPSRPDVIGVFVDYEECLVNFYDVRIPSLIFSFTGCSFPAKLYPFFSPGHDFVGNNSAPLAIRPVSRTI